MADSEAGRGRDRGAASGEFLVDEPVIANALKYQTTAFDRPLADDLTSES